MMMNEEIKGIPCLAFSSVVTRSSSDFDSDHGIKNSILNFKFSRNTKCDGSEGWRSGSNDKNQYVIAASSGIQRFVGISIQGRGDADEWVSSFLIRYSLDNKRWYEYKNGQVFNGNIDRNGVVNIKFEPAIIAKTISLHPITWNNHISLRWELYTDDEVCSFPQIQMGNVSIGDKTLSNNKGPIEYSRCVTFDKPFVGAPCVSLGIKYFDFSKESGQNRCAVEAKNITNKGFEVIFKRFSNDNLINDCSIDFVAFWKGDDYIPSDNEFKNPSLFLYNKK
ncbi:hypothetical protein DICPUDRAFT_52224 [Dictyostelium purpureum]|uniref:F5/8 type C domain-containing protein n=1 Tax=Dictyostelium purpureum TaxID=5786 RepID=F0Z7H7_DICPU|nr:uncharacterized protein DICPUDRAFT_52224 [Dictyostelium purpureum]EGC40022.1 hypothetical protein DICPUDRAFT_52224 [Dictyostelium purpureum]|eukprot:XP_003283371.1 hypothetical protein DICPUDRAFT_52224 [Dictyostelium purpureum]